MNSIVIEINICQVGSKKSWFVYFVINKSDFSYYNSIICELNGALKDINQILSINIIASARDILEWQSWFIYIKYQDLY